MAIKIKAQQMLMNVGPKAGKTLFVMRAEKYSTLGEKKLFDEASVHSGMPAGAIRSAWYACGDIIQNWLTEGHAISVPGIGTMRFGVSAKAVELIDDVSTELVRSRKVIFTPAVSVKQALDNTALSITCYDTDGNLIKREEVTEETAA